METRRFARKRYVRVQWDGTDITRWHAAADILPLYGAQLAIEYARRRSEGQPDTQAASVYHGHYDPTQSRATRHPLDN